MESHNLLVSVVSDNWEVTLSVHMRIGSETVNTPWLHYDRLRVGWFHIWGISTKTVHQATALTFVLHLFLPHLILNIFHIDLISNFSFGFCRTICFCNQISYMKGYRGISRLQVTFWSVILSSPPQIVKSRKGNYRLVSILQFLHPSVTSQTPNFD